MRYLPIMLIVVGLLFMLFGWQQTRQTTPLVVETQTIENALVVLSPTADGDLRADEVATSTVMIEDVAMVEHTAVSATTVLPTDTAATSQVEFAQLTATPFPIVSEEPPTVTAGETLFPTRQAGQAITPDVTLGTATGIVVDTTPLATVTATPTLVVAQATAEPTRMPIATDIPISAVITAPPIPERFGVTLPYGLLREAEDQGLVYGSYLNWNIHLDQGGNYWRMIRTSEEGYSPNQDVILAVLAESPGSYWLIGNEMDVFWQDNVTPERYVEIYHELYWLLKENDPSAKVAIGGVSQSTSLRRAYLDQILDQYQARYGVPMPIDLWNVHAFILPESRDGWGVGLPPGTEATQGEQYTIEQHIDMTIFRQNIVDFRAWMAERGYQNRPLVVSEYGVLMPPDFGFPPDVVADFITETFDFFLTAANETGYPADDGRLVQWWFWYGLYDPHEFPSGNLYDQETEQLTAVGEAFSNYPRVEP